MKRMTLLFAILFLLLQVPAYGYESLQEVFNNAGADNGYDKYIELDPYTEYAGDLYISGGERTRIIGNGALIFGSDNNSVNISYTEVDISGCVFIGGYCGIMYSLGSYGKAFNNTFYDTDSSGIRTYYPLSTYNVEIYNNIIKDCYYGISAAEDCEPAYVGYNILNNISMYNYALYCYS
jgi:hypothetical protein